MASGLKEKRVQQILRCVRCDYKKKIEGCACEDQIGKMLDEVFQNGFDQGVEDEYKSAEAM